MTGVPALSGRLDPGAARAHFERLADVALKCRDQLSGQVAELVGLVLGTFAFAGWITLTRTLEQRTDTAVRESARVVAGAIRAVLRRLTSRPNFRRRSK